MSIRQGVATCSRTRENYTKDLGFPFTTPPSSSVSAQATQSYSILGQTNVDASSCRIPYLKNDKGRGRDWIFVWVPVAATIYFLVYPDQFRDFLVWLTILVQ